MIAAALLERLNVPIDRIEDFCARWKVRELSVFGSAARGEMRPESDVDVLVEFEEGSRPHRWDLVDMKLELEDLLGRPVDLVEMAAVENPFRRRSILRDRTVIYAT